MFEVRILSGQQAGVACAVPPAGTEWLSVGSSPASDLVLETGVVPGHWCRFAQQDGTVLVQELSADGGWTTAHVVSSTYYMRQGHLLLVVTSAGEPWIWSEPAAAAPTPAHMPLRMGRGKWSSLSRGATMSLGLLLAGGLAAAAFVHGGAPQQAAKRGVCSGSEPVKPGLVEALNTSLVLARAGQIALGCADGKLMMTPALVTDHGALAEQLLVEAGLISAKQETEVVDYSHPKVVQFALDQIRQLNPGATVEIRGRKLVATLPGNADANAEHEMFTGLSQRLGAVFDIEIAPSRFAPHAKPPAIDYVQFRSPAFVMLRDGRRVFEGGVADGFRLESLESGKIVMTRVQP